MDESSDRSLDQESDRVRDRMIDREWSHLEIFPELDRDPPLIFRESRKWSLELCLLEIDELVGHSSSIEWDRSSELLHSIKSRSDMIDMSMSDAGSDDFLATAISEVRDTAIDTILILIRELESEIDDDHLVLILESHTVQPDLLDSSEWDDSKGFFLEMLGSIFVSSEIFLEGLLRSGKWE